jgi:hypothetical protein
LRFTPATSNDRLHPQNRCETWPFSTVANMVHHSSNINETAFRIAERCSSNLTLP